MMNSKMLVKEKFEMGEVTVDGLFHGFLAGAVMLVFLAVAGLTRGESPLTLLARFSPGAAGQPLTGALLHLAVSAVYAGAFSAAWNVLSARVRRGPSAIREVLAGLLYGGALFMLGQFVILPRTASPLLGVPAAQLFIAHILYGACLGWLFYRSSFVKES